MGGAFRFCGGVLAGVRGAHLNAALPGSGRQEKRTAPSPLNAAPHPEGSGPPRKVKSKTSASVSAKGNGRLRVPLPMVATPAGGYLAPLGLPHQNSVLPALHVGRRASSRAFGPLRSPRVVRHALRSVPWRAGRHRLLAGARARAGRATGLRPCPRHSRFARRPPFAARPSLQSAGSRPLSLRRSALLSRRGLQPPIGSSPFPLRSLSAFPGPHTPRA
jgi:hypothetical protein